MWVAGRRLSKFNFLKYALFPVTYMYTHWIHFAIEHNSQARSLSNKAMVAFLHQNLICMLFSQVSHLECVDISSFFLSKWWNSKCFPFPFHYIWIDRIWLNEQPRISLKVTMNANPLMKSIFTKMSHSRFCFFILIMLLNSEFQVYQWDNLPFLRFIIDFT